MIAMLMLVLTLQINESGNEPLERETIEQYRLAYNTWIIHIDNVENHIQVSIATKDITGIHKGSSEQAGYTKIVIGLGERKPLVCEVSNGKSDKFLDTLRTVWGAYLETLQ